MIGTMNQSHSDVMLQYVTLHRNEKRDLTAQGQRVRIQSVHMHDID